MWQLPSHRMDCSYFLHAKNFWKFHDAQLAQLMQGGLLEPAHAVNATVSLGCNISLILVQLVG